MELQNLLNPEQKGKPQLQSAARVFRVGDKVMQVRNNYEIVWQRIGGEQGVGAYNGDIGIVESINTRERSMVVRMDDRRLVYPAENLNELEIAYAITVHKSQGSEFPAVILPVAQVPPRLCYRNLFYTGVTRARKLCMLLVQSERFRIASALLFHRDGRYGKRHRMTENAERAKLVYFLPQLCYTEL